MYNPILKNIIEYLEYMIIFMIIIECNSLFGNSIDNGSVYVGVWFVRITIFLTWICFALESLLLRKVLKGLRGFIPILIGIGVFSLFLYIVNVCKLENHSFQRDYIRSFLLFLPSMCGLLRLKRAQGQPFDLIRKHADIMSCFAFFSVILYLTFLFHSEIIIPDLLRTRWSGVGGIRELLNYLNLCNIDLRDFRDIVGIRIYRCLGFFPEPPMACIPLVTALYTELFLRRPKSGYVRAGILSAAIVFSQGTLGMMLMVAGIGLKILQICPNKWRKRIVVPGIVCVGILFYILIRQKVNITGNSSLSSLAIHIDDYKVSLKAFLRKPLFGWGYNEEAYIRQFMSEQRLISNSGLSNSVAVILAEGGIVLGAFCMLPYALFFACLRKKEHRQLALWGVGVFGLYCLMIFHYHLFFMSLIAFGYSLLDIREDGYRKIISLFSEDVKEMRYEAYPHIKKYRIVFIIGIILIITSVFFSQNVWELLYIFMKRNQLLLGQSVWKPVAFISILILGGVLLKDVIRQCADGTKKFYHSGFLKWFVYSFLFGIIYPVFYSIVRTTLTMKGLHGNLDFYETLLISATYFGGLFFILLLFKYTRSTKYRILIFSGITFLCLATVGAAYSLFIRKLDARKEYISSETEILNGVISAAKGSVYADELPCLYHRVHPQISYSANHGKGYAIEQNASVIVNHDQDIRELFEKGFLVSEISDNHLLYSNDSEVIMWLKNHDYEVNGYYPYETWVDLNLMADLNASERDERGTVLLRNKDSSLIHGPYSSIESGRYTATFNLQLLSKPDAESKQICSIRISSDRGRNLIAVKDITAEQFDNDGILSAEVTFVTSQKDNMEYLLYTEGNTDLALHGISIRQTPEYLTTLSRNGRRQIVQEDYYELSGENHLEPQGYCGRQMDYDQAGNLYMIQYLDEYKEPVLTTYGYAKVIRTYNGRGLVIKEEYLDENDRPVSLPQGYAGFLREYNNDRQLTKQKYLDPEGNPVNITAGYAEFRREYDDKMKLVAEEYYDPMGKLVMSSAGYARVEYEYDDIGNQIKVNYYDIDHLLTESTNGYAVIEREYNDKKQNISEKYCDKHGNMTVCSSGYATIRKNYDDAGNVISQSFYDTEDKSAMSTFGYSAIRRTYNENRRIIKEEYYGTDGELLTLEQGYAKIENIYDADGNQTDVYYFDIDGNPTLAWNSFARAHREFNKQNQMIKESYFDKYDQPCTRTEGYAINEREYDTLGNIVLLKYCDISGRPVIINSGYSELHRRYNVKRQMIAEEYYGIDGQLIELQGGYSCVEYQYDNLGNPVGLNYIGKDGKPCMAWNSYAGCSRVFNENKQIIKEMFLDVDGNPIMRPDGFASIEREYDNANNMTVQRYLDLNNQPVMNASGYAELRKEYDEGRRVTKESYYDTMGKIVDCSSGYAFIDKEYDEKGVLVKQVYYDKNGSITKNVE